MASTPLLIPVGTQFFDNAGKPLSGGFLYTYAAGSTSPQNTYSDNGLSVLNPNPIPLDAAGRCSVSGTEVNVYPIGANYKIVLTDVNGVQIWSHDFVDPAAGWDVLVGATLTSPTILTPTIVSPTITTSVLGLLAQVCQGRLTLTSGVPVTSGDVTGATAIFFTPYTGNLIGLFDGLSVWTALAFSELTLNLGTLTSGLPYDVFAFNNNGVVALRTPVAWTNTTTRATALVLQNGIYVKSGATTDRYLGTFFTTSTTQTEDSILNRYLWNYYNRVPRQLQRFESTATWTYTTATVRQANGSTSNQVNVVVGVQEALLDLFLRVVANNTTGGVDVSAGIGEDSTTTYAVGAYQNVPASNQTAMFSARLVKYPTVGRHFYSWNEWSTAGTGTTNWDSNVAAVGSSVQAGLAGFIPG
jgi:hypothetical protein